MARSRKWRNRVARIIYRAYPDHDLLPVDPPRAGEPIRSFAARAQVVGDGLFLFLCQEADDDIGAAEYVARLDRAINDIEYVRAAFLTAAHAPRGQKGGSCRLQQSRH